METKSQALQTERKSTTTTTTERRTALARILFSDRLAHNFDPRSAQDTALIVEAFLPILEGIPTERLHECYVAALKKRGVGDTFQIRAVEILQAWQGMEQAVVYPSHLLGPSDHCWRCKNTRVEVVLDIMTDKDITIPCQTCSYTQGHEPINDHSN